MSLIQQALEKAGKVSTALPAPEKIEPAKMIRETLRAEEKIIREMSPRLEKAGSPALVFYAAAAWALLAAVGVAILVWFFLTYGKKTETSPVMMAGVSSTLVQIPQASSRAANTPKFVLTGVTESNGAKLALINNQVAGVGDRLREKAFVKSINEDSVVLDYDGREIRLNL